MKLFKNFAYAFAAQFVGVLSSVMVSLIIPKVLGLEDYAYWQLFTFYSSYSMFFHFGLIDGVHLRYAGVEYEQLDRPLVNAQLRVLLSSQAFISTVLGIIGWVFFSDGDRQFVVLMFSACMILSNLQNFLGYMLIAVNRISVFSRMTLLDRISFIVLMIVAMLLHSGDYRIYVYASLLARALGLAYIIAKCRSIALSSSVGILSALKEAWRNINAGFKLMIAGVASTLLIGNTRFFVDFTWGITDFSKFSFAVSIATIITQFSAQAGLVLFPAIKKASADAQKAGYQIIRNGLSIFLPAIYILYIPIAGFLAWWLPQYQESLHYMVLLLPICVFDGKYQILCYTYYKAMRKEALLMRVNLITLAIGVCASLIGCYLIKDIYAVVMLTAMAVILRSVIGEYLLAKIMKSGAWNNLVWEILMTVVFIVTTRYLSANVSFAVVAIAYATFLLTKRKSVRALMRYSPAAAKGRFK